MANNYAAMLGSDPMGVNLSNKLSDVKLNMEADPAEIRALVNKYTRQNKPSFKGCNNADNFQKQEVQPIASNPVIYSPSAPVINQNTDYSAYHQGYYAPSPAFDTNSPNPQMPPVYQQANIPVQYSPQTSDIAQSYASNALSQNAAPQTNGSSNPGLNVSV